MPYHSPMTKDQTMATVPTAAQIETACDELVEALWWIDKNGECAIHIRRALEALGSDYSDG